MHACASAAAWAFVAGVYVCHTYKVSSAALEQVPQLEHCFLERHLVQVGEYTRVAVAHRAGLQRLLTSGCECLITGPGA